MKAKKIKKAKVGQDFKLPDTLQLSADVAPETKARREEKQRGIFPDDCGFERFNGKKWTLYDKVKITIGNDWHMLYLNRDIVNMKNNQWLMKKLSEKGFNTSPNVAKKNPIIRMVKPDKKKDIILFTQGV